MCTAVPSRDVHIRHQGTPAPQFELCHFVLAQGFASQTTRQKLSSSASFASANITTSSAWSALYSRERRSDPDVWSRQFAGSKAANVGIGNFAQLRHVVVKVACSMLKALSGRQLGSTLMGKSRLWRSLRDAPENRSGHRGADHFHVHLLHDAARGEVILASSSLHSFQISSAVDGESNCQ